MKNVRNISTATLIVLAATIVIFAGVGTLQGTWAQPSDALEVVCTTSQMSSVVAAVGGEDFETHTIIPFAMCPGHFDLSPREAQKLLEAPLLLHHGYERFLDGIDAKNSDNKVHVDVKGNWMIPEVHMTAVTEISRILSEQNPSHAQAYSIQKDAYLTAIETTTDSLRLLLSSYQNIPVICAAMNRDFAEWTGVEVLADFPRDEDMSIAMMQELLSTAHERGVRFVIDNKQSGGHLGRTLADDLNVPLIVLTNFPETETTSEYPYLDALRTNCGLLLDTLNITVSSHSGDTRS